MAITNIIILERSNTMDHKDKMISKMASKIEDQNNLIKHLRKKIDQLSKQSKERSNG